MASTPGLFTDWPWKKLGNFKYLLVVPWVASAVLDPWRKGGMDGVDLLKFWCAPVQLLRMLHSQLWISLARHQTASGRRRIVNRGIEFEQVDRERNWDDQVLLTAMAVYLTCMILPIATRLPWWDARGVALVMLLHAGPVEFLYYWFHRALHHHYLYSRYHSHHHSSIVTEPITAVIHPFAEEFIYFLLFAGPMFASIFTGTGSLASIYGYMFYIDFMNYMGHCNFEMVPKWVFNMFPHLKYVMYTPSFHSLHHTQFRTNYSLFMPFYDYVYGTADRNSDCLYENSLRGKEEVPDVVHLTHPTSLPSIYQARLGFASLASRPCDSTWWCSWMLWPLSFFSPLLNWVCGSAFTIERNRLGKLEMQTWAIPRYSFQYHLSWEREAINDLIEKAIKEADDRGTKVVSLGLLNQGEELNRNGKLYIQRNPKLKVRIVDGSGLAAAVVVNGLPRGTNEVLFRGKLTKAAYLVVKALCQNDIQVITIQRSEFEALKLHLPANSSTNLVFSSSCDSKVWLVGDGLTKEEQKNARSGTLVIPFSQFPPRNVRKDCTYHCTPAMMIPESLENMHTCENWLPRRVMSAWRIAGIVHALKGWDFNETDGFAFDLDRAYDAALEHGFRPLTTLKA